MFKLSYIKISSSLNKKESEGAVFILYINIIILNYYIHKHMINNLMQYNQLNNIFFKNSKIRYALQRRNGRNNTGKITVRFRGSGVKARYLAPTFNYPSQKFEATILKICKNPMFQTANLCFTQMLFENGIKLYGCVLANQSSSNNTIFFNYNNFDKNDIKLNYTQIQNGNILCIKNIPVGTSIFGIEQYPNTGAKYCRAAGSFGVILKHDFGNQKTFIKLKSGHIVSFPNLCRATIGVVAPVEHQKIKYTKAGERRTLNFRPHVRGVAMNPVDHPHGGGEGKSSGGRCSVSKWGILTKGKKTVRHRIIKYIL